MMIHIKPRSCSRSDAQLHCEHKVMRAIIGKNGVTQDKQEGDHATPIGIFSLRQVFYRADRIQKPDTVLPVEALTIRDGWCDDPTHSAYNQKISLPHSARHEALWREDNVYDLIVVIGYNDEKIQPGRGSAIFMHLQRENKAPTEGCVALTEEDLRAVLASGATAIHVHASDD